MPELEARYERFHRNIKCIKLLSVAVAPSFHKQLTTVKVTIRSMGPKLKTLYSLQYMRAIAAVLVVLHHVREQFGQIKEIFPSPFGAAGVDLFFVISGFIMVYVTHDKPLSTGDFLRRRLVRVVPLYWLFTLLMMAMVLILPSLFRTVTADWWQLLASLLFVPFEDIDGRIRPLISIGWTLQYEMFFYVVFAAFLWAKETYRLILVMTIFCFLFLARQISQDQIPALVFYGDAIIIEFALGMVIAVGWFRVSVHSLVAIASLLFGLGAFAVVAIDVPENGNLRTLFFGVPAALIVFGAVNYEKLSRVPQWNGLRLLGDASYALYLSHIFTLGVCRFVFIRSNVDIGHPVAVALFAVVGVSASVAIGIAVHILIEKPVISALARWPSQKKTATA